MALDKLLTPSLLITREMFRLVKKKMLKNNCLAQYSENFVRFIVSEHAWFILFLKQYFFYYRFKSAVFQPSNGGFTIKKYNVFVFNYMYFYKEI